MHDGSAELKEARGRTVKKMAVVYDEEYCAVGRVRGWIQHERRHHPCGADASPVFALATGDTEIRRNYKARVQTMGLNIEPFK
jgi:hypothetical protein